MLFHSLPGFSTFFLITMIARRFSRFFGCGAAQRREQWRWGVRRSRDLQHPPAAWADNSVAIMITGHAKNEPAIRAYVTAPSARAFHRFGHAPPCDFKSCLCKLCPSQKADATLIRKPRLYEKRLDQISSTGRFETSSRTFSAKAVERYRSVEEHPTVTIRLPLNSGRLAT